MSKTKHSSKRPLPDTLTMLDDAVAWIESALKANPHYMAPPWVKDWRGLRARLTNAWRPMSEAPKDGTRILILDADQGVVWAEWKEYGLSYFERWVHGWIVPYSENDDTGGAQEIAKPLSWLPMPEAPAKGGANV